jgi:DNA invertase Pin-like site-specific DNA recombinase
MDHEVAAAAMVEAGRVAEDRRRDIVRKTRDGLAAARARGRTGGRPRVVDADKRRIILARHNNGESIRTIARATKVSIGTVHKVLADHRGTSD